MTTSLVRTNVLEDGTVELVSPAVGLVLGLPGVGEVVTAGRTVGAIETLQHATTLVAPTNVTGRVVRRLLPDATRVPVGYGTPLFVVDPRAMGASIDAGPATATAAAELVFRAPMSGRFYSRTAPSKPPLVEVGAILELGQPACLLEVMKTFHRVVYGGEGLPARVRIVRVVPADGDDVVRGAPILELEPA